MVFDLFSFLKIFRKETDLKIKEPHKTPELKPYDYSSINRETLRKIKSSEDFIKIQIPWIL